MEGLSLLNVTYDEEDYYTHEDSNYPEKISTILVDVIVYSITAIGAIFNLGSFITILVTKKMTSSPKYIIIMNMNIVFLVMGLFVITGEHRTAENGNCSLYYHAVLFEYLAVGSILSLSVLLNIDYIMRIVKNKFYETNKKYVLFAVLLLLVYVINALLIVPYYIEKYSIQEREVGYARTKKFCAVVFPSVHDLMILTLLCSVPQSIFVIITLILSIIVFSGYKKSQINTPTPTEFIVIDIILLLFCIIPPVASLLNNSSSLYVFLIVWVLPFFMTIIVPLLWLIDNEYRQAVKDLLCCRCRKNKDADSYEMM
ncbi:hypothetical protein LOTGIDRAFT_165843 [Lottia gigantea]|uniref:G-protein coupled receptors family 1 profile domain-containing protein n=1 Tax=Lottia gigantea TaxID=225164 RepID=V4A4C5_LOTGI|nr:hypothetical protein LOTGIDRAFT_165843 [Lottia gigantea]ESO88106.1 hypothetical protein LOTGIDRAFT_165843 [Lottia gigantea]